MVELLASASSLSKFKVFWFFFNTYFFIYEFESMDLLISAQPCDTRA